jgi:hypothetical protein
MRCGFAGEETNSRVLLQIDARLLRDENLQDLTFVIDRAPQAVHLAIDLDVHLVEVPARV